ncbi:hypothetical protein PPHE_a0172 [Pseudoalteromonas phenolica O-BC30]|nr:hypothetical protein [Pseudoalteromonas phenolica O-BC30]
MIDPILHRITVILIKRWIYAQPKQKSTDLITKSVLNSI